MTVKLPTLQSWNSTFNRWRIELVNALFTLADGLDKSSPVGVVAPYAGIFGAPRGWLLANGDNVSRAQYSALYSVIGTTYGVGDGLTTFGLPDLRGRSPIGLNPSVTAVNAEGKTIGQLDFTVTIPAHYHGMGTGADLAISSSGSHSHSILGKYGNNLNHAHNSNPGTLAEAQTSTIGDSASATPTSSDSHSHASGDFTGRIGLVTGGVNGNAAMTSGTANAPALVTNFIIKY